MGMRLAFMMMVCLLLAIIWFPSYSLAQNSPQDYLDAHNTARRQVGVGPMGWDNGLATYALNYANSQKARCPNLVHSGGPYGENLAVGTGAFSGRQAVELWVSEKKDYNYGSNSCASGKVCGHYTQVVWRDSVRLGCARVKCTNNDWWYVICSYAPRGNIIGRPPY